MSSMIIVPNAIEPDFYDWSYLKVKGSQITSYLTKNPFHYTESTMFELSRFETGFEVAKIHNYGHPFQKLVEFRTLYID